MIRDNEVDASDGEVNKQTVKKVFLIIYLKIFQRVLLKIEKKNLVKFQHPVLHEVVVLQNLKRCIQIQLYLRKKIRRKKKKIQLKRICFF
jgi:hypothetical protein